MTVTTPRPDLSAKEVADPFDVAALRANPPAVASTESVIVTVAARRPSRHEFFRVHPGIDYTVDGTVLEYEGPDGRQDYWVPPNLRSVAPQDVRAVRIFTCMSKAGVLFLWPARIPAPDGAGRVWHASGLAIAELAKEHWVKMVGNRAAGAYQATKATGDLGLPQWPDGMSLQDMLRLAFGGERIIDGPDHDVLRAMRGEI